MPSATSSQLLSIIAQSMEGYQLYHAQLHETHLDSGVSGPIVFHAEEYTTNGLASDAMTGIETWLQTETATADDTQTFDVAINLEATAVGNVSMTVQWTTTLAPRAGVAAGYPSRLGVTYFYETVAYASSTLTERTTAWLVDNTALADGFVVTPGVVQNATLTDVVYADDDLYTGLQEYLQGTATADNVLTDLLSVSETLSDTVLGSEVITNWAAVYELLTGTAAGSESSTFNGSIYNTVLVNTATANEVLWAPDFGALAWVLNTKSGGLSSYNNYGFNSIAFHDGKLYATSPMGIYELDADTDDGRLISAHAKGGFLDFGSAEKKRMSDIFVGYTGGDLECDVETYGGGKDVYTYEMEHRDADAPRNNRLKVGRGLSSRYWRLTFRNVNGADFQIQDVSVQIATSKRRL